MPIIRILIIQFLKMPKLLINKHLQILRIIIILLLIVYFSALKAQTTSDLQLIKNTNQINLKFENRGIKFGFFETKNKFIQYNPITLTFSTLMYLYQKGISPQISANCLYSPSCSQYSKQLIREFGLLKGIFTTADRLTRCNRLSANDVVPDHFDKHDHKIHENTDYYRLTK